MKKLAKRLLRRRTARLGQPASFETSYEVWVTFSIYRGGRGETVFCPTLR